MPNIPNPNITKNEAKKFIQYFDLMIKVKYGGVKSFVELYPELASVLYKIADALKQVV